jgi:hypothetical protein
MQNTAMSISYFRMTSLNAKKLGQEEWKLRWLTDKVRFKYDKNY